MYCFKRLRHLLESNWSCSVKCPFFIDACTLVSVAWLEVPKRSLLSSSCCLYLVNGYSLFRKLFGFRARAWSRTLARSPRRSSPRFPTMTSSRSSTLPDPDSSTSSSRSPSSKRRSNFQHHNWLQSCLIRWFLNKPILILHELKW